MGATSILRANDVLVDEVARKEAQAVSAEVKDRRLVGLKLQLDDGTELDVPEGLAETFHAVISGVANGRVQMKMTPTELTSTSAADVLGISRPTLLKMVDRGEISSRKVGSHRRFLADEVFALAELRREGKKQAFAELRAAEEALEAFEELG